MVLVVHTCLIQKMRNFRLRLREMYSLARWNPMKLYSSLCIRTYDIILPRYTCAPGFHIGGHLFLWEVNTFNPCSLTFVHFTIPLLDFVLAPICVIWRQFLIWHEVSQNLQLTVLKVRNESSVRFYIRNSFQIFIKSKIDQLWGCER